MNRFQEWKITTKATLIASAVAATVAAGVASGTGSETTFHQTAATGETTTSTMEPVTTSAPATVPATEVSTTTMKATSTTTTSSSTTTTTAAPAMTVDVVLGAAVDDESGTRVPVTVTVTHGKADVTVCLSSTIVEQGTPYHGGLPFYDVSGTQTLDWTYQYAGQHVTDVHIVKKLVDSRYGCMP